MGSCERMIETKRTNDCFKDVDRRLTDLEQTYGSLKDCLDINYFEDMGKPKAKDGDTIRRIEEIISQEDFLSKMDARISDLFDEQIEITEDTPEEIKHLVYNVFARGYKIGYKESLQNIIRNGQ